MTPGGPRRGAAFLDRDGVVNVDVGYAHRPDQITWIEGIVPAIRMMNQAGLLVFVVTNQSGVARGYYDEAQVQALHRWMAAELAAQGARVDDWRYCPHHPDATVPAYRQACTCRKPAPGMLLDLMSDWPVDPARSFLIGDRDSDLQAAARAGVRGYRFGAGGIHELMETVLRG